MPKINFRYIHRKATEKQLKCIQLIEAYTPYRFKGKTRADACEFIGDHIEESRRILSNLKDANPDEYDDCDFDLPDGL